MYFGKPEKRDKKENDLEKDIRILNEEGYWEDIHFFIEKIYGVEVQRTSTLYGEFTESELAEDLVEYSDKLEVIDNMSDGIWSKTEIGHRFIDVDTLKPFDKEKAKKDAIKPECAICGHKIFVNKKYINSDMRYREGGLRCAKHLDTPIRKSQEMKTPPEILKKMAIF